LLAASAAGDGERVNLRWSYEGALKTIVVDAGADGTVRGLINPAQLADTADLATLYGERGEIRVVRSKGGRVLASGTIEACFMDVIDDLTAFCCMSDQVESGAAVLVAFSDDPARPVQVCRGILLQAMPGSDLVQFERVRERLRLDSVRSLLQRVTESDNLFEDILAALTGEEPGAIRWTMTEAVEPVFRCSCGPEKMADAVRCLAYADRMDIVQKKEDVKIRCHFCNTQHVMSVDDCIRAWNDKTADRIVTG
jgi:molecular chaperone Hsp33